MPKTTLHSLDELKQSVGMEVAVSDWLSVDQARIDRFADATGDHQWIHVDPARAKAESPFGSLASTDLLCYHRDYDRAL